VMTLYIRVTTQLYAVNIKTMGTNDVLTAILKTAYLDRWLSGNRLILTTGELTSYICRQVLYRSLSVTSCPLSYQ